jgi:large subunit ribosomal protein L35
MPKQKTHKGLAKRVKITGRGKVVRRKANAGHLMSGKSGNAKRKLRKDAVMGKADAKRSHEALHM